MARLLLFIAIWIWFVAANVFCEDVDFGSGLLEFGTVATGQTPAVRTTTLKNPGTNAATVRNCAATAPFTADKTGQINVPPGSEVKIQFTYPASAPLGDHLGFYRCTLTGGGQIGTNLHVKILEQITVDPVSLNFGPVASRQSKTLPITIKNNFTTSSVNSTVAITLTVVANVSRALREPFKVGNSSLALNPQAQQTIQVTMNAGDPSGTQSGTLELLFKTVTSGTTRKITIPLTGTVTTN